MLKNSSVSFLKNKFLFLLEHLCLHWTVRLTQGEEQLRAHSYCLKTAAIIPEETPVINGILTFPLRAVVL